jgi:hypothetical protein
MIEKIFQTIYQMNKIVAGIILFGEKNYGA